MGSVVMRIFGCGMVIGITFATTIFTFTGSVVGGRYETPLSIFYLASAVAVMVLMRCVKELFAIGLALHPRSRAGGLANHGAGQGGQSSPDPVQGNPVADKFGRTEEVVKKDSNSTTVQSFAWLEQEYPDLAGWIRETSAYLAAEVICEIKDYGESVVVNLFTSQRVFHVAAISGEDGYLGLQHSLRSTGAGNDWTDGRYSKETWDKIVRDMLSCELIPLERRDTSAHVD